MRGWCSIAVAFVLCAAARAQEDAGPPPATPPARFNPTPVPAPLVVDRTPTQGMGQMAGYLVLLIGLFGGGIYVMRHGVPSFRMGPKAGRKLNIEETRSLGGRQFLVVAEYGGQRILLGVCPGRIDHLCALPKPEPSVFPEIGPEAEEKT